MKLLTLLPRSSLRVFVFVGIAAFSFAQHQHTADPEAVRLELSKLPSPQRLDGLGQAHITITTKSAEAQQWFDQGLAALHCFWDYEALRAFEQAVRLDPDCAMCHWGLARALDSRGGEKELQKAELKKAEELAAKASDHEQRYIKADAAGAQEKDDDKAEAAYAKQMEAMIDRYPDDLDARVLYALSLNHGYSPDGDPRPGSLYGQAVLREILEQHPDNAAANHYWIHAVEGSHPEWALKSAERLGSLAPDSGHMVHMPGHIFYRVGDYERARQIFLSAMRVDRAYMDHQKVAERDNWNYLHNISYLIADCAEEGRYQEAQEHAQLLQGLSNDPDRSGAPTFYVLQIGSTATRLAIRFGNWDAAIDHPLQFGVPDTQLSIWARTYRDGLLTYVRGMKAAQNHQLDEAEHQARVLDSMLWRLSKEDIDEDSKSGLERVLKLLGTASLEMRGAAAMAKGKLDDGRKLLERASKDERELGYSEPPHYSRPPLEVLGESLIRAGKYQEAREAYQKDLAERPHSGFALYGIATAWEKEGRRAEAAKAYREFLSAWSHADADLSQVKTAQAYVRAETIAQTHPQGSGH
ncbi:MAG TPA: tetratricopeptide repeat protein [Terriglobales bacterium]|nr:tetratricopeptide repeat protein [Terriglobales bacterium]